MCFVDTNGVPMGAASLDDVYKSVGEISETLRNIFDQFDVDKSGTVRGLRRSNQHGSSQDNKLSSIEKKWYHPTSTPSIWSSIKHRSRGVGFCARRQGLSVWSLS